MGSVKKNLGYQTVYQILATCLPLITSPYLSRVLGAEQLGIYSFTNSVVLYFTLFAMLGTVNYGTRSIAATKDDTEACAKTFWSIYTLQSTISIVSVCIYIIYLMLFCKEDRLIALIQMFQIVNCLLDINWLFFGLEKFKVTVTRNIFVKAATIVLLFILVRGENDLWKYTALMVGSNILSQLILWSKLPQFCRKRRKISFSDVIVHIRPNLALFIPLLAMSVYHVMDKTMLGIMSNKEQSGYYYNADKLVNIPLTIINGIGTVLLPRISNLISNEKKDQANQLFCTSIECVVLASTAMAFGVAAISNEFVPLFFGADFVASILITIVLSPVLVVKGISNTVRTEFLIPYHLERKFIASVIAGAVTNLIANSILIPNYGGYGAAIGTLIAEIVACGWQVASIWKMVDLNKALKNSAVYFSFGCLMYGSVRYIAGLLNIGTVFNVVIEVMVGVVVYGLLSLAYLKITNNKILTALLHR